MRTLIAAAFIAALAVSPVAHADAIPMPEQLSAEQLQLVGVWQEEKPLWPTGLGHSFLFRTLAFGNNDLTLLTYSGVPPANMYATSGLRGEWTAKRQDGKTLIVTLTQSAERGTELATHVSTLITDPWQAVFLGGNHDSGTSFFDTIN